MWLPSEMGGLVDGFNASVSSPRREDAAHRCVIDVELHEIVLVEG